MNAKEQADLLDEVTELRKKLEVAENARTEAEQMSLSMAQASSFSGGSAEEQPTGKTVELQVCLNPGEHDMKKLKFKTVTVPTFFYTIDLPVGAGADLATNGVSYYHGQTYEFDPDTLRDMKSRVARCWDHEKAIHSENENAYRRPTHKTFSGKGMSH